METCFKMLKEAPLACKRHKKYIFFLNQCGSLGFPETVCTESFYVLFCFLKLKTNPQLLQNSATLKCFAHKEPKQHSNQHWDECNNWILIWDWALPLTHWDNDYLYFKPKQSMSSTSSWGGIIFSFYELGLDLLNANWHIKGECQLVK